MSKVVVPISQEDIIKGDDSSMIATMQAEQHNEVQKEKEAEKASLLEQQAAKEKEGKVGGIMNSLNTFSETALRVLNSENVPLPFIEKVLEVIQTFDEELKKAPLILNKSVDLPSANAALFEESDGYRNAISLCKDLMEEQELPWSGALPKKRYETLFGLFCAGPKALKEVPKINLTLLADIQVVDATSSQPASPQTRAPRGEGSRVERKVTDLANMKEGIVFDMYWRAFQQDGPKNIVDRMTEGEKKSKNFYIGGGTQFFKRMEEQGLIPANQSRGYLMRWGGEQMITKGAGADTHKVKRFVEL